MKKNLLLMRHAKPSWKDDKLEDHERPLKKRGKKDATLIAKVMKKKDLIPDLILSSTAVRASETVEVVTETLGYDDQIMFADELYMGEPQDFVNILRTLGDEYQTVMIVAHNPGLEAYLQIVNEKIEALPTAALGHLVLSLDSWKELSFETMGELAGFWTPKALQKKEK